jgi:hypothetical protein
MLDEVSCPNREWLAWAKDWPILCWHDGQNNNGGNSNPRQYASYCLEEIEPSLHSKQMNC